MKTVKLKSVAYPGCANAGFPPFPSGALRTYTADVSRIAILVDCYFRMLAVFPGLTYGDFARMMSLPPIPRGFEFRGMNGMRRQS